VRELARRHGGQRASHRGTHEVPRHSDTTERQGGAMWTRVIFCEVSDLPHDVHQQHGGHPLESVEGEDGLLLPHADGGECHREGGIGVDVTV
jgi:hypothetical protein